MQQSNYHMQIFMLPLPLVLSRSWLIYREGVHGSEKRLGGKRQKKQTGLSQPLWLEAW